MDYQKITLAMHGKVAVLTLNAPEVLNAVSVDMLDELSHAVDTVTQGDARCLLLTGAGRAFCAGANLQPPKGDTRPTGSGGNLESHYHPLINKLRRMDIPMVSAVNGVAAGVGMSFAIMADLVIAGKSAYFLQAFAKVGLVPDGGATYYLPRMIGWNRALELSLLAERLPAEMALEWGLVNRVFEDENLMQEATSFAHRLASGPKSLGLIRRAYWESTKNSFEEQILLEAELQAIASASSDHREGRQSFLEKRDPKFTGN